MRSIETERLIIRNYRPDDWRDLMDMVRRPEVREFEPDWDTSEEACRENATKFAEGNTFIAIERKADGKMLGHVYLAETAPTNFMTWELGYILNPDHGGRGHATEACRAVLNAAFREWGARRVVARCCPQNTRSWRLMERLGMRREGHFHKAVTFVSTTDGDPIWWDEYVYAALAEDWPAPSGLLADLAQEPLK